MRMVGTASRALRVAR